MKAGGPSGKERRQFFRHPHEKPVRYKNFILQQNKILASKLSDAVTKNLSNSGVLFVTKSPPELSSIVIFEFDSGANKIFQRKTRDRILMLNHKVFGKVVRIEEGKDGQYQVGVAFIQKTEASVNIIEDLLIKGQGFNFAVFFRRFLAGLFIIITTLSLNIIYVEHHKLYVPERFESLSPTSVSLPFEDINFLTADGESLNGWFIPAMGAKVTILYCHGNAGNISNRLSRLNHFYKMGFNVFIFDYRGYGNSTGKPSEKGLYLDAQAAYDYVITRKDVDRENIVVLGVSLGGPVAAELCLNRKVKALVLENTFVSLALQGKDLYPYLPVRFLLWEKYDTLSRIKKISIPKLFFHGIDDEVVSFKHARLLYDAALPPKVFVPFRGGHDDDIFKLSDDYEKKLIEFFIEYRILEPGHSTLPAHFEEPVKKSNP